MSASNQTSPNAHDDMSLAFQELYAAIGYGDTVRCRELLDDHKIDVNTRPEGDYTSLLAVSVRHGKVDMVNLFIEKGADPSLPYFLEDGTPYSIIAEAFYCADQEDGARTETPIKFYDTAFLDVIKILVEHGADLHVEINGYSLLDFAACCPYAVTAIIEYFVKQGVKASNLMTQDIANKACEIMTVSRDLLSHKSHEQQAFEELWVAVRSDSLEGVKKALDKGAVINGMDERIPLEMAILNQNLTMMQYLIQHPDIDLTQRSSNGKHLLDTCFYTRNFYAGFLFFKALIKVCPVSDEEMSGMLRKAIEIVNPYIVSFLCANQYGNPLQASKEADHGLKTPFALAASLKDMSFYHGYVFDVMECYTKQYRKKRFEAIPEHLQWHNIEALDFWFFRNMNYRLSFTENGLLETAELLDDCPMFVTEMPRQGIESEIMPEDFHRPIEQAQQEDQSDKLKVFDVDALKQLLKLDGQDYKKLLSSLPAYDDGYRKLQTVNPEFFEHIEELKCNYPNMVPFIEYVEKNAILREFRQDASMYFPPVLLVSKPGVGKTACVKAVADLLSLPFNLVDFSTSTANWMMTGSSSSWKDAKPGKVFNACVRGEVANPLFLCDEIDKAAGDSRYPVVNVFYTLLERDMARQFSDEFYPEFKIDASNILYVATANSIQSIPDAILSRFHVIEIQEPSQEQMPAIINSVYRSIRESDGHQMFPELLTNDVIEYFVSYTPRQVKGILNLAFANAAYRTKKDNGRLLSIAVDDLQERKDNKRGIGFIQ